MGLEMTLKHLTGSKKDKIEVHRDLPLWIGRSDKCQVRFTERDLKVSALHAEVSKDDAGEILITDLDSRNGVLVNGRKVEGKTTLPNHAVVEVGVGGPRLRFDFEESGGISFAKISGSTAKLAKKDLRADSQESQEGQIVSSLASTEESFPVYSDEDLFSKKAGVLALVSDKYVMYPVAAGLVILGLIVMAIVMWT